DSGAGTLRQAIADACATDSITFSLGGAAQTITLTSGELVIGKNLTITGPGAALLTLSGNNASRVFHLTSGRTVSISDVTIANGPASRGGFGIFGGAIFNQSSALTIARSTIRDSVASDGTTGFAGAIYNFANPSDASLTITASTLSGNTAAGGTGAIESHAGA